jgi:hypothetical protein
MAVSFHPRLEAGGVPSRVSEFQSLAPESGAAFAPRRNECLASVSRAVDGEVVGHHALATVGRVVHHATPGQPHRRRAVAVERHRR